MALYDPDEQPKPEDDFPLTIYLLGYPAADLADAKRGTPASPQVIYAWGRLDFPIMRRGTVRYAAAFQSDDSLWDNIRILPEYAVDPGFIVRVTLEP